MTITSEIFRELASRREGPALDFKLVQYDWNADGNLELAKDLMAIANGLSPDSPAGHILTGVDLAPDQTGRLVGVGPTTHLDDAIMHGYRDIRYTVIYTATNPARFVRLWR
jgi:hypothetical protein